ncbi:hypothetical protein [Afipia felis]|uniref:Uncharacterized protein n=2 Tax=Afipia felis TaxID=1035 RepID=A0A380W7U7_AFIFE|nr:hypothetical protein [Afipia felis]EKS26519.1 hypothetical protein HMPREF9697_04026 [Afipia felis ATCC 53690]SUU76168.1 Uncharacterised protein [Afipia felis]SUU84235.1 Uncharacterised protein [Afipia felis]
MPAAPGTPEYAANLALGHLGVPELASLDDQTTRARNVRRFFASTRDALLRRKDWNFASSWFTPTRDTVDSLGHFKGRYPMPSDCIAVRELKGCENSAWALESGQVTVAGAGVTATVLVTNQISPIVRYTRRIENVALWDALFVEAFGYFHAADLATALGKSKSMAAEMRGIGEDKVPLAAKVDSKEQSKAHRRPPTSWELARHRPSRYRR